MRHSKDGHAAVCRNYYGPLLKSWVDVDLQ